VFANSGFANYMYIFFLFPPFAFYRGVYLIGWNCTLMNCLTIDSVRLYLPHEIASLLRSSPVVTFLQLKPGEEMLAIVVALILESIFYMPIALYLDAVMPRTFGLPKPWLFFLDPIKAYFKSKEPVIEVAFAHLSAAVFLVSLSNIARSLLASCTPCRKPCR